jgi:putative MATE family efflux protein
MNKNMQMTQGHPAKLMFLFALPLMAGNVFQQLYTVVDTAIIGQGVGMEALAALGTVDWISWMVLSIAQGLTQGFGVKMAQKFGQQDAFGLKQTVALSARLSAILALGLAVLSQLAVPMFMWLLRVPQELRFTATSYIRTIFLGIPAMMFYNFCASVLRAVGDSQTPLRAMILASITNIVLDCIAVFALGWGVVGAAAATVIAQIGAGGFCAVKLWKKEALRFDRSHFAAGRGSNWKLLALGVPLAAQNVIICVGGMSLQSIVNGFGTTFIAGYTATNKLYGLLEIAAVSYGFAVTTYTGQNYGAKEYGRIRSGTSWAILLSVVTSAVIAAMMLIFGRDITMLFISADSAELELAAGETAYRYLCIMSSCLPVLYLLHAYRSALQGMGNVLIPMLSGGMELIMRVGFAFIAGGLAWQEGVFLAEVFAWTGAAVLLAVSYYISAAKLKKVAVM